MSNATDNNHGIVDTSDTVYTVPEVARMFGRKECTIREGTYSRPQDGTLLVHPEVGTGGGTERYLAESSK